MGRRRADGWAPVVLATLGGGLAGFVALAELRLGPILAAGAGLGAYALLLVVLDRVWPRPAVTSEPADTVEDATVALLAEAELCARRLDAAADAASGPAAVALRAIGARARVIAAHVTADPARLPTLLRAFTYYLPAAAELGEDRARLAPQADARRLLEIDDTLARLADAFAGFERQALAPDLQELDLDLRLIDQALASDTSPGEGPRSQARRDD
jgi:hypothetical protein